jgi:hypothetical protein
MTASRVGIPSTAAAALAATLTFVGLMTSLVAPTVAQEPIEIFDAHLHYNWEPKPYYELDKVLELFRQNRVTGIIATSRPNDGTRALVDAGKAGKAPGLTIVPFIRPYRVRADIASWMGDPKIFDLVQEEYARGYYVGIGEFHLSGKAAANDWVKRTVDFAVEKNLILHCHCDAEALEILFRHNAKARIIWAHTGFSLEPPRVEGFLEQHKDLWGELSYRGGITDGTGKLTADWRDLFTRYPDRFVLGSDTWINERWASYSDIMAGYRGWLAQLPPTVAAQLAHGNARRIFGP